MAEVRARSERRRVVKVDTALADAIRVVADGDAAIGVCEIRAYR